MWLPRTARILSSSRPSNSVPSSVTEPPTMRPGGSGTSRMIDSAVTLFLQPDSPTIASVSPRRTLKDTSSTALNSPELVKNTVCRFFTSRTTSSAKPPVTAALPRVENVAQRVTKQIGAEHRQADGDAGEDHQPWRGTNIL